MKANTVERTARNLRTACISHIDARLRGILLACSPISEIILSAQEVAHPSYGTPSRDGPVGAINIATSVTREITVLLTPAPAPPSKASSVPTLRKGQPPPRLTRGGVPYGR